MTCSAFCYFQLNAEKSPFQRTYATQVCMFSTVVSRYYFFLFLIIGIQFIVVSVISVQFRIQLFALLRILNVCFTAIPVKIKRCGEMARTLRFFKEQMLNNGVSPTGFTSQQNLNIDDLEVHRYVCSQSCFPCFVYFIM